MCPPEARVHSKTVVIVIHPALGVPGYYYNKLADWLCERNDWVVAVQEQRGQGSSSWRASRACNWSYWTPVVFDFPLHLQLLRSAFPTNPLFALGHSVGFVLWSLYLAKTQLEGGNAAAIVSGVLGIGTGSIYYGTHPASYALLARSIMITMVGYALGWFPGEKIGFGGPAEARGFMLDWCRSIWFDDQQPHECPHPRITNAFKALKVPMRLMTLQTDAFTPPSATARMAARFDPQYTSFHFIDCESEPEYKDFTGEQAHVKWARGTAILPHIESWIAQQLQTQTKLAKL